MADRSSRPWSMPTRTPPEVVKRIVRLRWRRRLGPCRSAASWACRHRRCTQCSCARGSTGSAMSTAAPASRSDATSTPTRDRSSTSTSPSSATSPTGAGTSSSAVRRASQRPRPSRPDWGTVIDDHSRVPYIEICADEKSVTAIGVLEPRSHLVRRPWRHHRARALRQRLGLPVPRLARRLHPARDPPQTDPPLQAADHERSSACTAPRRRVAYARFYSSETERRAALSAWLHFCNHHRTDSTISGPPISRLNNLPGHHNGRTGNPNMQYSPRVMHI
jgi:hypothetical protein